MDMRCDFSIIAMNWSEVANLSRFDNQLACQHYSLIGAVTIDRAIQFSGRFCTSLACKRIRRDVSVIK